MQFLNTIANPQPICFHQCVNPTKAAFRHPFSNFQTSLWLTVVTNRDLISGYTYVLTLNFEILQVAYFQFLIIFLCKNCHFFSFKPCIFSVWTLRYFQNKITFFFGNEKKKNGLKSCILMAVWIFFFSAAQSAKTTQDRKFILEICLKIHLFSNLCFDLELTRGFLFKCHELASRTSKDLNFVLLPCALRQNLDKNQNLDKQINSFHIQITLTM